MRILMASLAIAGHFNPLTGIAMRLVSDGHDVRWYTGPRYTDRLAELGITHHQFDRAVEHTPENLDELFPQRARLKGPRAASFDAEKLFASNVGNFFEDIADVHGVFAFDVLVVDALMVVQRLVRERLRVPVVSVVPLPNMRRDPITPPAFFGLLPATGPMGRLRDRFLDVVSRKLVMGPAQRLYTRILDEHGVRMAKGEVITDEAYRSSTAVLQAGTSSFDFPRQTTDPRLHFVGPLVPYRDAPSAAGAWPDTARRYSRTVFVTQGTVDNKDLSKLILPTLEALADTDTLLLVATGGSGTDDIRRRYPQENVVIEDFIDFDVALARADVFVTNGGFGGVLLSLAHGVPMVTAGVNEGKNDVNARVEYHRVGINLRTEKPASASIRAAVDRVGGEPAWRARAAEFQAEFATLDPPAEARRVVTEVVASAVV